MTILDASTGKPPYDDVVILAVLNVRKGRVKQRQLKAEKHGQ